MKAWLTRSVARRVAVLSAALAAAFAAAIGLVVVRVVLRDEPDLARQKVLLVAVFGGAATVASVAIATWAIVNRLLSRSLRGLTDIVRAAQQGKFLARARSTRTDEIGELARAIDALGGQITDLSVAVIDGTRELEWTRSELRLKEALTLLFELSQTVGAETDVDGVVSAIPGRVAPALGLDEMAILLYDEASDTFVVRATYGFPEAERVEGMSFGRGEGLTGAVAATGEPIVISDTASDERYLHYKGKHMTDGSFVCVPLKVQGRVIGLFNVLRPRRGAMSEGDVRLLTSLANYCALAIAHAAMNQRLRDLSVTDELTGLSNRRHLVARAAREAERARRTEKPLTALMVDLDHFKRVNDEHGHLRGDQVLRDVARTLRESVRRIDTVARYGGEEFVVLLPDTSKTQAVQIAEKLRQNVRELEFGDLRITISVGVATLFEDADGEQGLFDAADRALLAAKRAGRDRVVAHQAAAA